MKDRRIARARSQPELTQAITDITQAYGEPPSVSQRLFDLARLRIGAQETGVRSIALHEQDVIIRCTDPGRVAKILEGVQGSVRVISAQQGDPLREVFFRPPPQYLQGDTLLTVLRRRFAKDTETA